MQPLAGTVLRWALRIAALWLALFVFETYKEGNLVLLIATGRPDSVPFLIHAGRATHYIVPLLIVIWLSGVESQKVWNNVVAPLAIALWVQSIAIALVCPLFADDIQDFVMVASLACVGHYFLHGWLMLAGIARRYAFPTRPRVSRITIVVAGFVLAAAVPLSQLEEFRVPFARLFADSWARVVVFLLIPAAWAAIGREVLRGAEREPTNGRPALVALVFVVANLGLTALAYVV